MFASLFAGETGDNAGFFKKLSLRPLNKVLPVLQMSGRGVVNRQTVSEPFLNNQKSTAYGYDYGDNGNRLEFVGHDDFYSLWQHTENSTMVQEIPQY